jgi:hypothetical protein
MTDPSKRHLSLVTDGFTSQAQADPASVESTIPTLTTPPCPSCGHHLTAAYDDLDDSWWECSGCGCEVEDRDLR